MRTGNATHFSTFSQRFKPSLKFPSKLINIPSRKSCSFQYILSHPEHTSQTLISSMTWVSMTPVLRETLNNKLLFPLWHASNHTEDKNLSSNRVTHDHVPKKYTFNKILFIFFLYHPGESNPGIRAYEAGILPLSCKSSPRNVERKGEMRPDEQGWNWRSWEVHKPISPSFIQTFKKLLSNYAHGG